MASHWVVRVEIALCEGVSGVWLDMGLDVGAGAGQGAREALGLRAGCIEVFVARDDQHVGGAERRAERRRARTGSIARSRAAPRTTPRVAEEQTDRDVGAVGEPQREDTRPDRSW